MITLRKKTQTILALFFVPAILCSVATSASAQTPDAQAPDHELRLNQIQVVGTHNSYQLPADPRVMRNMKPRLKALFDGMQQHSGSPEQEAMKEEHPNPLADSIADALDYIQAPIEMQLRAGVRSLELDLQADPNGGLFADPLPYRQLRASGETDLAPIYEEQLRQPGMKVFHLADVDFRSQCPRFRQCLTLLRQWSGAHPGHSPVFILLEPKLSGLDKVVPGAAAVAPFDKAAFDEIDAATSPSSVATGSLLPTTCAAPMPPSRRQSSPRPGPPSAACAASSSSSTSFPA